MSNNMLQRESYWLSVEGQTEKLYFAWLAQQINEVDHRKKNLKLNIKVEKSPKAFAKKLSIQSAAHYVHVCDVEIDQAQFKSAAKELYDIEKAKSMKYHLAYCNCSFELWLILHKMDCATPVNTCDHYLQHINKAFGKNYQSLRTFKSESEFTSILASLSLTDVESAIARAKALMAKADDFNSPIIQIGRTRYRKDNPALNIHEIVEEMLRLCGVIRLAKH